MEENNNNNNENVEIVDYPSGNKNGKNILTNALTIAIAIVISVVVLFALYVIIKPQLSNTLTSEVFSQEQLERLETAAQIIADDYLYEYDTDELIDGAISGMVDALDNPYTYYETEEEYQETLNSGSNANYVGIGVHLTYDTENDAIRVLGTVPDSPAELAGIMAGDVIIGVDDLAITKDTYTTGVNNIRGEEDTTVTLTILRDDELLTFEVTRATITENNVTTEVIDNIGYIRIYSFDNGVYEQFKEAYENLLEQDIEGLIVDLRNNPGGYVSETIDILNLLLPEGEVLKLVDKNGKEQIYETDSKNEITIPLAVVVNQNSASASEIFASAVKDYSKGVVVGTQTYGKGVVQYVRRIKGHGAIDIVAAQYFTSSGVVIQDNGIEPDYVVEVDEDLKNNMYISRDKDTQLQTAIDYIKNQL